MDGIEPGVVEAALGPLNMGALTMQPWWVQLGVVLFRTALSILLYTGSLWWWNKTLGLTFKRDYWPVIATNPWTVLGFRLGNYAVLLALVLANMRGFIV